MRILQAKIEDFKGINLLHRANHLDFVGRANADDGFVTANLTDKQLKALIVQEKGAVVAKKDNRVVAFAMAASWDFWQEWPFSAKAVEKLTDFSFKGRGLTRENCYKYGPVCVDKSVRGSGVFEKLFAGSLASMAMRYPVMVAFIDVLNKRSFAAHTRKVNMESVGMFQFKNSEYYVMACLTAKAD